MYYETSSCFCCSLEEASGATVSVAGVVSGLRGVIAVAGAVLVAVIVMDGSRCVVDRSAVNTVRIIIVSVMGGGNVVMLGNCCMVGRDDFVVGGLVVDRLAIDVMDSLCIVMGDNWLVVGNLVVGVGVSDVVDGLVVLIVVIGVNLCVVCEGRMHWFMVRLVVKFVVTLVLVVLVVAVVLTVGMVAFV